MEVLLAYFPHCEYFVTCSTLWMFCWHIFHIVEVFLANFPHCGNFVSKKIPLSTLWMISHNAFHILEDITVFQAFLPQNCFTYITFTIHIIGHSGYFFHILIWAYRFTGTSTNPSAICQNSSASMLAALAQYSISAVSSDTNAVIPITHFS